MFPRTLTIRVSIWENIGIKINSNQRKVILFNSFLIFYLGEKVVMLIILICVYWWNNVEINWKKNLIELTSSPSSRKHSFINATSEIQHYLHNSNTIDYSLNHHSLSCRVFRKGPLTEVGLIESVFLCKKKPNNG